jgi:surfactin synthase thioesterase subunit
MNPFVRPRPIARPVVRLIAFHHAAGSAGVYYPLRANIPDDWDLLLLDLPGRGKRYAEAPIGAMSDVVARALEDIAPWLDAPFALFGHSLGAIVAAEVGRECESRGAAPLWVGISGRVAPSVRPVRRGLHELGDEDLLRELFALGGTPPRIGEAPEFLAQFLRNARIDLAAVDSYAPAPARRRCGFPMTAFAGADDPWAPPPMMAPWEEETTGGFRLREFDGGHFYFLGGGFADLARTIVADVERHRP